MYGLGAKYLYLPLVGSSPASLTNNLTSSLSEQYPDLRGSDQHRFPSRPAASASFNTKYDEQLLKGVDRSLSAPRGRYCGYQASAMGAGDKVNTSLPSGSVDNSPRTCLQPFEPRRANTKPLSYLDAGCSLSDSSARRWGMCGSLLGYHPRLSPLAPHLVVKWVRCRDLRAHWQVRHVIRLLYLFYYCIGTR